MSVKSELLELAEIAVRLCAVPEVREVFLPDPEPSEDRDAEFGMVILEDGSAGLYYAWLGEDQAGMNTRYQPDQFKGMPVMDLLGYYRSDDPADCSLGLAALNAVTSSFYRRAGFQRNAAGNSLGGLQFNEGDHVGMIGYFPSLISKLRERQIRLTVLEKKSKFLEEDGLFRVVLDPECLRDCNKVVSTASTLLNNSIDEVLEITAGAGEMAIIGPTAGFFPDPLFRRGVTAIGGSEILNATTALLRLKADQRVGDAGRKFITRVEDYPGMDRMLHDGGLLQ
ncbi:MAG: hypothetical protein A3I78_01840 [Gammaproteobacteria bacterium RIFCSPLOWO2_02_FULL_56_15]|nr:MAG: hypothetical protein A3I78_01840 [Gammaproteobacteria bacterium RIFCSPLOWO2_02_FULL_56_15]